MAGIIMKPPEVAKILGVSQQAVREHMKRGLWDIGDVFTAKERSRTTYEYNIYPEKLEKLIGGRLKREEITEAS